MRSYTVSDLEERMVEYIADPSTHGHQLTEADLKRFFYWLCKVEDLEGYLTGPENDPTDPGPSPEPEFFAEYAIAEGEEDDDDD